MMKMERWSEPVRLAESKTITDIPSGSLGIVELHAKIDNPAKWTAETPNLYTVVLVFKDEKATHSKQQERYRFQEY